MPPSRKDKDKHCMSTDDDESDSTTDDESDSIFDDNNGEPSDNDNETDMTDYSENSHDASLFDDEEQHPPEYYPSGGANLNPKRLRQRQYGPKTQDRLDWVKEHCI